MGGKALARRAAQCGPQTAGISKGRQLGIVGQRWHSRCRVRADDVRRSAGNWTIASKSLDTVSTCVTQRHSVPWVGSQLLEAGLQGCQFPARVRCSPLGHGPTQAVARRENGGRYLEHVIETESGPSLKSERICTSSIPHQPAEMNWWEVLLAVWDALLAAWWAGLAGMSTGGRGERTSIYDLIFKK